MLLYLILSILLVALLSEGKEEVKCSDDFIPLAGKCYRFYQQPSTWSEAKGICEEVGATLASVKTKQEYKYLLTHINSNYGGQYWLSGALIGENWVWTTDGSAMNRAWFGTTPVTSGNYCAYFCSFTKRYWNGECQLQKNFICQENELDVIVDQNLIEIERPDKLNLDQAKCEADFIPIAGKCYRFYQRLSTWSEANGICEEVGATLASVKMEQEYSDLLAHINANYGGQYWLSGSLIDENWVWTTDGSAMNRAWFGTTPVTSGNYCAYFCSFTKRYWDGECQLQKNFICQKNELDANEDQNSIEIGSPDKLNLYQAKCETDFIPIAGKCYRFYQRPSTWLAAESICEEVGATLPSVKTEQEYTDLLTHIDANYGGQYWLSGSLIDENWVWTTDGSAMNRAWFGTTPVTNGKYCAYFCSFTKRYWYGECQLQKNFICQKNELDFNFHQDSIEIENPDMQNLVQAKCEADFISIAGKCYRFYQRLSTWSKANDTCEEVEATLASVKTEQEYSDLLTHINVNYGGQFWLSGSLIDENWVWTTDGSAMNRAWFGTTPVTSGNYCAYFCSFTKRYWDGECQLQKNFICQKNELDANEDQNSIEIGSPDKLNLYQAKCQTDFIPIAGKCYHFYQRSSTWLAAESICEEVEATLASVKTEQEYSDLLTHIDANYGGQYWLSGSLIDGNWVWTTDGSTMNRDWFGTTPVTSGNYCAYFCSFTKRYWDGECQLQKNFICQKNELDVNVDQNPIEIEIPDKLNLDQANCETNFIPIAGKCYRFYQRPSTWLAAEIICEEVEATLASVKTGQEYTDLLTHINTNYGGRYWISGSLVNGTWIWSDGSAMNSAWFGRTPVTSGNYCAYFCSFTNKYWDGSCELQKNFICQKNKLAENDSGYPTVEDEISISF